MVGGSAETVLDVHFHQASRMEAARVKAVDVILRNHL
jgi:hypothetical protein